MNLKILTTADVLTIHDTLTKDFVGSRDPISPPGVRSLHLLESAVSRQEVSFGGQLKYQNPIDSAATLAYGICCNHAFHNGNKRTALVSMLVHLDRNKLALFRSNQDELYSLMLSIADHTVGLLALPDKQRKKIARRDPDSEVASIVAWLQERVAKVARGERSINYAQLRKILQRFGFELQNPKGNSIDLIKITKIPFGLGLFGDKLFSKRIGNIPYPGEKREVGVDVIKMIRTQCKLAEEHGVDSDAFYSNTLVLDEFINKYRTVLRRLAQT